MTDGAKYAGMVLIPDSRFIMGSEGITRPGDEKPRHEVRVTDYYIDKHEVTSKDYAPFDALKYELVTKECKTNRLLSIVTRDNDRVVLERLLKANRDVDGKNVCGEIVSVTPRKAPGDFDGPEQPVVRTTWHEANAYCEAQGKRLPTEAEWEKAAIGSTKGYNLNIEYGTQRGQLSKTEAVYDTYRTAPVCSKPENGYGLCDMAGNVWEWVSDWYDADYYESSPSTNPTGPESGRYKVLRGGSWFDNDAWFLRAANRYYFHLDNRSDYIGFRCAASPEAS